MARYVDADKMLEFLEETNANYHWLLNQYNASWISDFIESQPTADVVPKSEVDEIIGKFECFLCHATGGRLSKYTYDLRTMEAVAADCINETYNDGYAEGGKEVAREIEEITRYLRLNEDISLKCKEENGEQNREYFKGKLAAFKQIRGFIDVEIKRNTQR